MPVSQSSSVITITNDTAKAVTAISAVVGAGGEDLGFRVECEAHGFADDGVVQITGTTDYNGPWLVSGVTPDTFDVTYQNDGWPGFTSSQTGYAAKGESSPDPISSMSGVTTYTLGLLKVIDLGANELHVEGAMLIDPRGHMIVGNVANRGVYVNNGGGLLLGKPLPAAAVEGSQYVVPGVAFLNTADIGASWWLPGTESAGGDGCFCVDGSDSYLRARGAAIVTGQFRQGAGDVDNGFSFTNGANIRARDFVIAARSPGLSGVHTGNLDIDGLALHGSTALWYSEAASASPRSVRVRGADAGLVARDTPAFDWRSPALRARDCFADIPVYSDTSTTADVTVTNSPVGANLTVRGSTISGTDSAHRARIRFVQEVVGTVEDSSGSPIEGAAVYLAGTDHGQRKDLNGFDDTGADQYLEYTDATGRTPQMSGVTAIVNVASTTSTPAAESDQPAGVSNDGAYRVDFRGKADTTLPASDDPDTQAAYDDAARFDMLALRYGYVPAVVGLLAKSSEEVVVSASLQDDPFVVIDEDHASHALFGITIDPVLERITVEPRSYPTYSEDRTVAEVYAAVKAYEQSHPEVFDGNGRVSIVRTADGASYQCLYDVEVSTPGLFALGGGVFDLGGKALTVNLPSRIGGGTWQDSAGRHVPITVHGLEVGTRVRLYDEDSAAPLHNEVTSGASTTAYVVYTADVTVSLRAAYVSSLAAKKFISAQGPLTDMGLTFNLTQEDDSIYVNNDFDGSTATEFTADAENIRINASAMSNTTSLARLYNWFQCLLATETGISSYYNHFRNSIDGANLVISGPLTVENVGAGTLYVVGGVIRSEDGLPWASGPIAVTPDRVYVGNAEEILDRVTLVLHEVTT